MGKEQEGVAGEGEIEERSALSVQLAAAIRGLAGLLDLAVFCKNPPLSEEKHNAEKTHDAAAERTDDLDKRRRLKITDKTKNSNCHDYGSESTQSFPHTKPPVSVIQEIGINCD
jgi:hypothetical protein